MKIEKVFKPYFDGDIIVFKLKIKDADNVYIAGTFNNWANNDAGYVTNPDFQFQQIEKNIYIKKITLAPGTHKFKFVVNNNQWFAPDNYDKDSDGNAIINITADKRIVHEPVIITEPHRSFYDIPLSNGFSSAKFNLGLKKIDSFKNHIYSNINEHTRSINLIQNIDFLLTNDQKLSALEIKSSEYINGTGILKVIFKKPGKNITAYMFCSFQKDCNNLNIIFDTEKIKEPVINLNPKISAKKINTMYQTSAGLVQYEQNVSDGYSRFSFNHYPEQNKKIQPIFLEKPETVLENEKKFWKGWHEKTVIPDNITKQQKLLYRQSLAVLKMGQCREPGKSYGQILASLPPGMWNICWIRDAAYAINGLIMANHLQEARDVLSFFLNADCGKYENFKVDGQEVGIGVPYQISVCRYFGNGEEESDGGDDPNIELDGFGLFLWVLEKYIDKSNDIAFLKKYWPSISIKIADVLVYNIDPKVNVIRKDSSIWERHIRSNGRENGMKYFTYTTVTAIKGLAGAANLAKLLGQQNLAAKYNTAVKTLTRGFLENQVDNKKNIIKDTVERTEISKYMDGCVVEAINYEIVNPKGSVAKNTIKAFDNYLAMKKRENGFFRNLDGTHYDNQEWIVIDLRIATALKKMGLKQRSKKLINWIVAQSKENYNIIAELYNENTANYEGAIPMCGFGPGAFISALW